MGEYVGEGRPIRRCPALPFSQLASFAGSPWDPRKVRASRANVPTLGFFSRQLSGLVVGPEGGGQSVWSSHRVPVRGRCPDFTWGTEGANIWQWLGHLDLLTEAQESPAGLGKQLGNMGSCHPDVGNLVYTAASEPTPRISRKPPRETAFQRWEMLTGYLRLPDTSLAPLPLSLNKPERQQNQKMVTPPLLGHPSQAPARDAIRGECGPQ